MTGKRLLLMVLLFAMFSLLIGAKGCPWKKDKDKDDDVVTGSSAPVEEFPLGLKLLPSQIYNQIPGMAAPIMGIGDLPADWDISGDMPVVKSQGRQGSCVGWAVAYAMKTHQERVERGWSLTTDSHLFSPAYIYNQINGGTDGGSYFYDALNILTSQGCATWATMPYDQNDYTTQPPQAARNEAAQYKAVLWRTVNYLDRTEIKKWLKSNNALPIAISVGTNFCYNSNLQANDYIYKSLGDKIKDMNGNLSYPGHAVTLVGWNDSKSAFKIINSWGENWGDGGYAWIDYDFFPQVCWEAYFVEDEGAIEMVSIPNSPSGPTSGNTGTSYSYSTGGSTSSLGHVVEYQFDWKGDGTDLSAWGSSTQLKTWVAGATYSVKARARCATDTLIVSAWSSGFEVVITEAPPGETVSTPNQPTGTASGYVNTSYDYSTGGSTSSLGHPVEYRFDFGDGAISDWSSSTTASKIWFAAGTYTVKSQARCATDTLIVSAWSSGLTPVTMSEQPETISTPGTPSGETNGDPYTNYNYSTSGASSSLGHSLQYRFDWGDGTYSSWSSSTTASHSWPSNTYTVKAQARCATHTSVVSSWSSGLSVDIEGYKSFSYTGGQQTWTVPAGVTSIQVDVRGAQGGDYYGVGNPGEGARVRTTLSVTPGQTLYIYVGGKPSNGTINGGYNGGGWGNGNSSYGYSSGGGGASDIRIGGTALSNRKVVAGGGGGSSGSIGGTGGNAGQNGSSGGGSWPGTGGTQNSGGDGGGGGSPGNWGISGIGGGGGSGVPFGISSGGGGGGGYYGGGGGGTAPITTAGGGGGGSSYSTGSGTSYSSGYRSGNGKIYINW